MSRAIRVETRSRAAGPDRRGAQTRSWRSAVLGGIAVSAAVHIGLFAAWSGQDPVTPGAAASPGTPPMQAIEWYASPAPAFEAPGAEAARTPRRDVVEEPVVTPEAVDGLLATRPARPAVLALGSEEPRLPRPELREMRLRPVAVAAPVPRSPQMDGIWPLIRNPREIVRFLRERYNPVLLTTGATGYVQVELWLDAGGAVRVSAIHESSGHPELDKIAMSLLTDVADYQLPPDGRPWTPGSILVGIPFIVAW